MIEALLFDVGGTLHDVRQDRPHLLAYAAKVIERLNDYGAELEIPPEELAEQITLQGKAYKTWELTHERELPPEKIWNEFYLKEYHLGEAFLTPLAQELSFRYDYERMVNIRKPHMIETLRELHKMGIRLGIISNITSTVFVPHILNEYGIADLFETVTMSSEAGARKPSKKIFDIAMERMHITADVTGYVGDTVSRDVLGSRNANLALCIQLTNPSMARSEAHLLSPDSPKPDYLIDDFDQILPIIRKINHI